MNPAIFSVGKGIEEDICRALSSFGYTPGKSRVLIKPNIAREYYPRAPYITDHRVVAGVIRYLQEKGISDISVGEGPVIRDTPMVFRKSGYSRMCRKMGVELIDFYNTERKHLNMGSWKISIPRAVLESEYINISKLKTHMSAGVTLCLKNQKGTLAIPEKQSSHRSLHKNIAALYSVLKPDLAIVDATSGVEGNGPGATGTPVKDINLLVIGTDALRVDFLSSMLMGMDPRKVEHLRIAAQGRRISFPRKTLEALSNHRMQFKKPTDHHKSFNFYYWWTDRTCSGCTHALMDLKDRIIKNPLLWPMLLFNGILRRVDMLSGGSRPPRTHGKIVCIGECTRELAQREGLSWAPGCPPKPDDIIRALESNKP